MSKICAKYSSTLWMVRTDLNKTNGQMRMTVENLDSEISQVVKNTRKSTILHKREKVKQHPNRVLDKLKLKFTYLQATCTPASTLLTFS